jgi:hypothetical protein
MPSECAIACCPASGSLLYNSEIGQSNSIINGTRLPRGLAGDPARVPRRVEARWGAVFYAGSGGGGRGGGSLRAGEGVGPVGGARGVGGRGSVHYHPSLEQVRAWIGQAGLAIEEEGTGK